MRHKGEVVTEKVVFRDILGHVYRLILGDLVVKIGSCKCRGFIYSIVSQHIYTNLSQQSEQSGT